MMVFGYFFFDFRKFFQYFSVYLQPNNFNVKAYGIFHTIRL